MKIKKQLTRATKSKAGRSHGRVAVRHQGGGEKQRLRLIDWSRSKRGIEGQVEAIEYSPKRNANVALLLYPDGERCYILATTGMKAGDKVIAGPKAPLKEGNATLLKRIPVGMPIHNLELKPGKGGQLVRSAGAVAYILSKDKKEAQVKLPSGEIRKISSLCYATIGQVGNQGFRFKKMRKAGQNRHRGVRPAVRGVAQDPRSHPHGGGEGRSGIGMPSPKTPWGKKTLGKKTRKPKKYSDKDIIKRKKGVK
ncbi:50S ribosomal protein L2 [Candidatus Shapirobacteria bacterium]|nr:50S ribosomal protein L2 [Candidatus Shapirobacteria bacterium]